MADLAVDAGAAPGRAFGFAVSLADHGPHAGTTVSRGFGFSFPIPRIPAWRVFASGEEISMAYDDAEIELIFGDTR